MYKYSPLTNGTNRQRRNRRHQPPVWYTKTNNILICVVIFWCVNIIGLAYRLWGRDINPSTAIPEMDIPLNPPPFESNASDSDGQIIKQKIDIVEQTDSDSDTQKQTVNESISKEYADKMEELSNPKISTVIGSHFDIDAGITEHWCYSRDYLDDAGKRSSCVFKNLCVIKTPNGAHEVEWIYVSDDEPVNTSISFTLGVGPHSAEDRVYFEPAHFTPEAFTSLYPKTVRENGSSAAFYEYSAENFGHMLPDVLLPIYAALEALDMVSDEVKLFRYSIKDAIGMEYGWSCDYLINVESRPDVKEICEKMYKKVMPLLTKNPVQILNASVDVPVCFESLVVGMSQYSDDCMEPGHGRKMNIGGNINCNTGRQHQFWSFRNNGLQNMRVDNVPPIKHQIVVTNRSDGGRALHNLNDLVVSLKKRYGDDKVLVVDWATLSMKRQLEIISQTTVHLTPPGGISYIAFFLPRWASTIRLYSSDYLLDWHIFNYLGYIRPLHVNCPKGIIEIAEVVDLVADSVDIYDVMSEEIVY